METVMARILIAGCGDLGCALGLRLVDAGHDVFGLRRRTESIPTSIYAIKADLTDPKSLEMLPASIDFLVYSATPGAATEDAYQNAYVVGLRNVLRALDSHKTRLRRLFYLSSTSVYAQCDGQWVDELSSVEPVRFSGQRVLDGERLAAESGHPATSIRFGGIYGPGRSRLINRVRDGTTCRCDPPHYTNRIHRDDCARVIEHLLGQPRLDDCYVAVDDEPAPECEVLDWLASRLAVPIPRRATGTAAARRAGSKRVINGRLRATGFAFEFPSYREGYDALLTRTQPPETDDVAEL